MADEILSFNRDLPHRHRVHGGADALPHTRERSTYVRFVKPAFDRVAGTVLTVLVAPLMALVAAVVWVSLGTPILLRQQRVGQHGQLFTVYKFRTMHPDRRRSAAVLPADERRMTHKHPGDPRLTAAGRILRRFSLDELPQLFNVVRGDMSLVGPRPELPMIVDRHYQRWQHRRHVVKPGMTGLWQVSERGNGLMHEHIEVDLEYVDRVCFVEDALIMLRTVPAALGRGKGY